MTVKPTRGKGAAALRPAPVIVVPEEPWDRLSMPVGHAGLHAANPLRRGARKLGRYPPVGPVYAVPAPSTHATVPRPETR